MGMTAPGETHEVEVQIEGPKDESETKAIMSAIREVLKKYKGAKVGAQQVIVAKKSRPPDP
jgi:hypothetical protein